MLVVEPHGRRGGLTITWKNTTQVNLLSLSKNHIDMEIQVGNVNPWCLTGFYPERKPGT